MPLAAAEDGPGGASQGHCLDLLQTVHQKLRLFAIARLECWRIRRALSVDFLDLVTAHALAPLGDTVWSPIAAYGGRDWYRAASAPARMFNPVPRKRFDVV